MKWEYACFLSNYRDCQTELDEWGDQGWELVSVDDGWFFLKRPIHEETIKTYERG